MVERPSLSKAEMEVARLVWDMGPSSVRQIHERLAESRKIDFSTVQTYLRRLAQKGYLNAKMDGRTRIYSPKVQRKTVVRETVNDLVQRLFGGDTLPLMAHLIEDRQVNSEQLAELKAMIDRLEEQQSNES